MTLIELMFAILIMTLVLLGAFYALITAQQMAEETRGRLLAVNVARSVLELVKNTPLDQITAINTNQFIPRPGHQDDPGYWAQPNTQNWQIAIATNPALITAATQLATVTVTVSWTGPKARAGALPLQLRVSTMRSRF